MDTVAKDNRLESYITRPVTRKEKILETMGGREMTPRMVAMAMGYSDLNAVRPRMTELYKEGRLEIVGKSFDEVTKKNTSLYKVKK